MHYKTFSLQIMVILPFTVGVRRTYRRRGRRHILGQWKKVYLDNPLEVNSFWGFTLFESL